MPPLATVLDPPPFGTVTRRWLELTDAERDAQARRLVGTDVAAAGMGRSTPATVGRYRALVTAAADGDPIGFAWLAVIHRPLLVARGRPLRDRDPSEWGQLALTVLHQTLRRVDRHEVTWLRRRVVQALSKGMRRHVHHHLARARVETPTDPARLPRHEPARSSSPGRGGLDLSVELDRALDRLDAPTREAFEALADRRSLDEVAARHRLTHAAVRQRVVRARPRLQSQLAGYHRRAG